MTYVDGETAVPFVDGAKMSCAPLGDGKYVITGDCGNCGLEWTAIANVVNGTIRVDHTPVGYVKRYDCDV